MMLASNVSCEHLSREHPLVMSYIQLLMSHLNSMLILNRHVGSARNEINFAINWDWSTNIPRSLHKREDICARPSQASSSPSPTTALPTSTTASLKTPTGEAAAASCYPHVDTGDNSGQTRGNKPPGGKLLLLSLGFNVDSCWV